MERSSGARGRSHKYTLCWRNLCRQILVILLLEQNRRWYNPTLKAAFTDNKRKAGESLSVRQSIRTLDSIDHIHIVDGR